MLDWLGDPRTIFLLAVLAALTILFGRIRREPWLAIASSTTGVVLAYAAIIWAGELGREVLLVVLLTGVGIFLMMHGHSRAKAARTARTSDPSPSASSEHAR